MKWLIGEYNLDRKSYDLALPKYEDSGKLRPYRRRWKAEPTLAWRPNWRRLVVGWEREIQIDQAFFHLAYILITLRPF
jgi:hypothetical protein